MLHVILIVWNMEKIFSRMNTRVHAEGRWAAYLVCLRGPWASRQDADLCCTRVGVGVGVGTWEPQKWRLLEVVHPSTRCSPTHMFSLQDTIRTCPLDNDEYKQWSNLGQNFGNLERKWPLEWDSPSLQDETLHPSVGWPDPWKPLTHPGHASSPVKWANSWSPAHSAGVRVKWDEAQIGTGWKLLLSWKEWLMRSGASSSWKRFTSAGEDVKCLLTSKQLF